MERLPQEIVVDILSRLPIPSLLQSKSVCRGWRCLILNPLLVNKHFQRMVENDPTFILQTDQPIQSQLHFGDYNNGNVMIMTKKLPMPPLLNFHLVGSCNGLLCLRDSDANRRSYGLCIYNPFTIDYTELPILTHNQTFNQTVQGFGFDPIAKQYKIVQVSYQIPRCGGGVAIHGVGSAPDHQVRRPRVVLPPPPSTSLNEGTVHVLSVGSTHEWRNLGTMPFHLRWQQAQVLVNGKLHWVSYPNRNSSNLIVSFDLATEQFQEVPKPDHCRGSSSSSAGGRFDHVVILGGCLSFVCPDESSNEGWEIWVMKTYGVKESWSKEFNIGAYLPQAILQQDGYDSFRRVYLGRGMRVLCLLRSGEVLLEYTNKALVVYHPRYGTFKDLHLTFEGDPKFFKVILHVSTLNWFDTSIDA